MPTDELRVKCPTCGWWLAKVKSPTAEVEVNCVNWNCKSSVVIKREGVTVGLTVIPKKTAQA